jgi:hypothetical protein
MLNKYIFRDTDVQRFVAGKVQSITAINCGLI